MIYLARERRQFEAPPFSDHAPAAISRAGVVGTRGMLSLSLGHKHSAVRLLEPRVLPLLGNFPGSIKHIVILKDVSMAFPEFLKKLGRLCKRLGAKYARI